MKNFSNGKIVSCLAAIFLLGVATGGIVVAGTAKKKIEQRYETTLLEASIIESVRARLELTPEQLTEIKPLVDLACQEYRAEQSGSVERVLAIIHNSNQRVAKKLSPEQVVKLEEWERGHEAGLRTKFNLGPTPKR